MVLNWKGDAKILPRGTLQKSMLDVSGKKEMNRTRKLDCKSPKQRFPDVNVNDDKGIGATPLVGRKFLQLSIEAMK